MTDAEWLVTTDFPGMVAALGDRVSVRKARLFACACCRQVEPVAALDRTAAIVETGEQAADGDLPPGELSYRLLEATKRWGNPPRPSLERALLRHCLIRIVGRAAARDTIQCCGSYALYLLQRRHVWEPPEDCPEYTPSLYAGRWDVPPEYTGCAEVVCGVLRELFGDSPSVPQVSTRWPTWVRSLAESVYAGEDCAGVLHDALLEADLPDLAAHFEKPFHPRGCWVVDAILKKR
jgi:hypothetical protein